uniref:Uncharacterized protein n=1 Tax=Triticum urartu TaxID=4572 RepID=A0A8R7QS60_TRIUA
AHATGRAPPASATRQRPPPFACVRERRPPIGARLRRRYRPTPALAPPDRVHPAVAYTDRGAADREALVRLHQIEATMDPEDIRDVDMQYSVLYNVYCVQSSVVYLVGFCPSGNIDNVYCIRRLVVGFP